MQKWTTNENKNWHRKGKGKKKKNPDNAILMKIWLCSNKISFSFSAIHIKFYYLQLFVLIFCTVGDECRKRDIHSVLMLEPKCSKCMHFKHLITKNVYNRKISHLVKQKNANHYSYCHKWQWNKVRTISIPNCLYFVIFLSLHTLRVYVASFAY